jgi:hypothetical protein
MNRIRITSEIKGKKDSSIIGGTAYIKYNVCIFDGDNIQYNVLRKVRHFL